MVKVETRLGDKEFETFDKMFEFLEIYKNLFDYRDPSNDIIIKVYSNEDAEKIAKYCCNELTKPIFTAFIESNSKYKELLCRVTLSLIPIIVIANSCGDTGCIGQDCFERVYDLNIGDFVWYEKGKRYGYVLEDPSKHPIEHCLYSGIGNGFNWYMSRFDLRVLSEAEVNALHLNVLKEVAESDDPDSAINNIPEEDLWVFNPIIL